MSTDSTKAKTEEIEDLLDNLPGCAQGSRDAWPKMLAELVDVTENALLRTGLDPDKARREAEIVIVSISEYLGGRMTYLPRNDKLKNALRDNRIMKEFTGSNLAELVEKYRLTRQRIYLILKEQAELRKTP